MSFNAAKRLMLPGGTPGEMMERDKHITPGKWRWEARATGFVQGGGMYTTSPANWLPVWKQFISDSWKKYQGTLEECIAMSVKLHPWWFAQDEWQFRITDGTEVIPMELFS